MYNLMSYMYYFIVSYCIATFLCAVYIIFHYIHANGQCLFNRREDNYNEYTVNFQETWQQQRNQSDEYISKKEHQKELQDKNFIWRLMEDEYKRQIWEKGIMVNYLRKRLHEEYDQKKYLKECYQNRILSEKNQQKLTEEHWKKKLQKELQKMQLLEKQIQQTKEMYEQKLLDEQQHELIANQCIEKLLEIKNNLELLGKSIKENAQILNEFVKIIEISFSQLQLSLAGRYLSQTVLKDQLVTKWDPMPHNKTFIKVEIQKDTDEFTFVKDYFEPSSQKVFQIVKIERIQNPYILGCYMLKKLEMENTFGACNVREINLFHGTKARNVDNICENNFNWRQHGESTGNRFGRGVSFTPLSGYANHYSDKCVVRVMFLVRVLLSKVTVGNQNMEIPPLTLSSETSNILRFDTTVKQDVSVLVKYSDNDFYPLYLIHYSVLKSKNRKRRKRKINTTNS